MHFPAPPAVRPINRAMGVHPLLSGLVSYWAMDEASGDRADSKGSNTLTSNNSVTSTTGKVGSAARFASASTQYLSRASNSTLQPGNTSYTFACWIRMSVISSVMNIVAKSATGFREYEFLRLGSNKLDWWVYNSSNVGSNITATSFGATTTNVWYFVVFGFNAATNKQFIQVNNGTEDSVTPTITPSTTSSTFTVGARSQLDSSMNGDVDELGFWSRVLTTAERTTLYNGGAGLGFSSF